MDENKNNNIYEKTSFLQGSNSQFIKELYLQYIKNPSEMPESWKQFFDGLNEDKEIIKKEILGPSWGPKKDDFNRKNLDKDLLKNAENSTAEKLINSENFEKEKEQSVKAIALIRAYRIRGHLIANLVPLRMMERKYLFELHPNDHGFEKKDYNKKIYLNGYLDRD